MWYCTDMRERLDRIFSVFVRVSRADHAGFVYCYTCGFILQWQEAQCGHFIRRAHSAVRFDEANCRPQCSTCNEFKNGMEQAFEENLRDDLGNVAVDTLIARGRTEKHYSDEEYKHLITTYTSKVRAFGVTV